MELYSTSTLAQCSRIHLLCLYFSFFSIKHKQFIHSTIFFPVIFCFCPTIHHLRAPGRKWYEQFHCDRKTSAEMSAILLAESYSGLLLVDQKILWIQKSLSFSIGEILSISHNWLFSNRHFLALSASFCLLVHIFRLHFLFRFGISSLVTVSRIKFHL